VTEAAERLVRLAFHLTIGVDPHRNFSDYLSFDHKDRTGAPLVTGPYANPSFLCDPSVPKLPRFGGAPF
jgi:hypothetical protein